MDGWIVSLTALTFVRGKKSGSAESLDMISANTIPKEKTSA